MSRAHDDLTVDELKMAEHFERCMGRLQYLEAEVVRLRKAIPRVPPTILELFKDAGWSITQSDDGQWWYSIKMKKYSTGGGGFGSSEAAIRSALSRAEEMLFASDYDDDDGWEEEEE